jgi:hypothetical protein
MSSIDDISPDQTMVQISEEAAKAFHSMEPNEYDAIKPYLRLPTRQDSGGGGGTGSSPDYFSADLQKNLGASGSEAMKPDKDQKSSTQSGMSALQNLNKNPVLDIMPGLKSLGSKIGGLFGRSGSGGNTPQGGQGSSFNIGAFKPSLNSTISNVAPSTKQQFNFGSTSASESVQPPSSNQKPLQKTTGWGQTIPNTKTSGMYPSSRGKLQNLADMFESGNGVNLIQLMNALKGKFPERRIGGIETLE